MSLMEFLNQLSILIAIWVSIYGIDSWRREHIGKRKLELAEDILALFYEAVDVIKQMRYPLTLGSETENILPNENETKSSYDDLPPGKWTDY